MDKERKKQINRRIKKHGGDILDTEEFRSMWNQTHHLKSSLGRHSVSTAQMGVELCDFLKRLGIEADEEKVVRTALLHDVGMLGRDQRYRNNYECGKLHPDNSAEEAKKFWKDIDQESIDAIKSHMWPLSRSMPRTKEGFILCAADKMASFKDLLQKKKRS